jgi:glycosyltransferase family protein
MKISAFQIILHKIRERTPLKIRQTIGWRMAFLLYYFNIYLRPNRECPHVLSVDETISAVKEKNFSVIRFGDGEISLIDGLDLGFQKYNRELAARLEFILQTKDEGLLLCVPNMWGRLDWQENYAYKFGVHNLYRYGHVWKSLLSDNQIYGETNMTRFYLSFKDKSQAAERFKKLFSIWESKDVVLIEGEKSRLGVGNGLFNNVKSLQRILCPPTDAYDKYEAIKNEAEKIGKDKMVLISLGPTAKVLAYDLFKLGYRVIDVGHIDMEYEMFLRKADKQIKVPFKYFNEINERNPEECKDEKYLSQIIAVIK